MTHFASSPRDDKTHNMHDITSDFSCLKVSALDKAYRISGSVRKVTIGPDSILSLDCDTENENIENEPNNRIVRVVRSEIRPPSPKISSRSAITFSIKKILLENELQRREDVRKEMQRRLQSMEKSGIALREQMALLREAKIAEREREERLKEDELARLEAEEEHLAQQTEIRRKHDQQLHAQRIRERQEKLEKEAEEQRRRNKERRLLIERMLPLQASFTAIYKDISSVSKSCKYRNISGPTLGPHSAKLKELGNSMEALVGRARNGQLTESDVSTAELLVKRSEEILNTFKFEIDRINSAYDAEVARREGEVKRVQAEEQSMAQKAAADSQKLQSEHPRDESEQKPIDQQSSGAVGQVQTNTLEQSAPPQFETNSGQPPTLQATVRTDTEECLLECADKDSLQLYLDSQQYIDNYRVLCSAIFDSELKKFRLECNKAIVIPVNAISNVSGDHLRDKYNQVKDILAGRGPFNANQHPHGVDYCKYLLAKQFVSQGERQVNSTPLYAFPFAAVAVALWNDYPDFGDLLLAFFRKTCPYLAPIFLPQYEGQSNEEYHKSLGYVYTNGVVEPQTLFIKRMSGIMRLYAAVTVAKQRRGVKTPHPHGLQMAWRWLAAILNIEPRPNICATLILDMLEVAGNDLWKAYPRQFPKLLALLASRYYPKMQSLNDETAGAAMGRLELFLQKCLTKGSIPPPSGQLSQNFW